MKYIYNVWTYSKNKEPAKPIGTENKLYNLLLEEVVPKILVCITISVNLEDLKT